MKYYIFLTPRIGSMGGAQMYVRNKVIDVEKRGYIPIVLFFKENNIYITDLCRFNQNLIEELEYNPIFFLDCKRKKILKYISKQLLECRECIIESHTPILAMWGELLARTLEFPVIHFTYLLSEKVILNKGLFDFLFYKYKKKELVGIKNQTLINAFQPWVDDEIIGYNLLASCSNTYENISCKDSFILPIADYSIGSIGRLDKPFVIPMLDDILKFVNKYRDKTFNLYFIGGGTDDVKLEIEKKLENVLNVNLCITDFIFPIPIDLILCCDVFISSAGSCVVSKNCGVPTIAIDGNDFKAIGILGYTTEECLFRKDEPKVEIDCLLEDVLILKLYKKTGEIVHLNFDFDSHWDFIKNINTEKTFYDFIEYKLSRKDRFKALLFQIFGFYLGGLCIKNASEFKQKVIMCSVKKYK